MINRITQLKTGIKEQYGTIGEFCKHHEIGASTFSAALLNKNEKKIAEYQKTLKSSKYISKSIITTGLLEKINKTISDKYGSVRHFCISHPDISEQYVSCLMAGDINKVTKKVKVIQLALGM